jgi:hypothetical protein
MSRPRRVIEMLREAIVDKYHRFDGEESNTALAWLRDLERALGDPQAVHSVAARFVDE